MERRNYIVSRTGVTQLDLSGNLLVGLPLALASLSNLIHLRKGGARRNAVFSEVAKKNIFKQNLKKLSPRNFILKNIYDKKNS
jgi:hypothetical protein